MEDRRSIKVGNARTEITYLQKLLDASQRYGPHSVQSGLILLSLQELFERQGRDTDAKMVERRVRKILISHGRRLGY